MTGYITVVFKCPENSVLKDWLLTAFKNDAFVKDAKITAVSLEDEITQNEILENKLNESDVFYE